jgi:hypothetical protein
MQDYNAKNACFVSTYLTRDFIFREIYKIVLEPPEPCDFDKRVQINLFSHGPNKDVTHDIASMKNNLIYFSEYEVSS